MRGMVEAGTEALVLPWTKHDAGVCTWAQLPLLSVLPHHPNGFPIAPDDLLPFLGHHSQALKCHPNILRWAPFQYMPQLAE